LKNAAILAINAVDHRFSFNLTAKKIIAPQHFVESLQTFNESALAKYLVDKKKIIILLGAGVQHHPQAAAIRQQAHALAQQYHATVADLTDGANSAGAWLAGAVPHRLPGNEALNHVGLSAYEMLVKHRQAYILLNVEPDKDFANAHLATQAFSQANFVLALSTYRNPVLEMHADIILPIAAFTETSGTYVNTEGKWQSVKGMAKPIGGVRPAWKVLRALANFLQLPDFAYESSDEIRDVMQHIVAHSPASQHTQAAAIKTKKVNTQTLWRIGEVPMYAVDALTRRAPALQAAQFATEGEVNVVRIHPETAKKLGLQSGARVRVTQHAAASELILQIDTSIAEDALWIAGAIEKTNKLGDLIGEVEITAVL
jgi:NADH-quinone oxidoreductase subunit G